MIFATADLCDDFRDEVEVLCENWFSCGGADNFHGEIVTIELDESNSGLVALLLNTKGEGRVVVVDVSKAYYAVVGDNLMKFAYENGWAGIVVNGYVRDTKFTRTIDVGLMALGTCPRKSFKDSESKRGGDLHFGDTVIRDGDYLYADMDGVVISKNSLI